MTKKVQALINNMDGSELRKTISLNFGNKEVVEYCERRLDSLNVDNALVEGTDLSDFGD